MWRKNVTSKAVFPLVGKRAFSNAATNNGLESVQLLKFCTANLKRCLDNVVTTDHCISVLRYPGTSVKQSEWVGKGEERMAFKPSQPFSANMHMGTTTQGVTKARIVTWATKGKMKCNNTKDKDFTNMTAAEHYDVVKLTLLPGGKRLSGYNGKVSWHLEEDSAPTNKRSSAKALKE